MNCRSLLLPFFLLCLGAIAQEWSRFRGPKGSGVSASSGFPTEFNKGKNLVWRKRLCGPASLPLC